jgi:hypothetical protein
VRHPADLLLALGSLLVLTSVMVNAVTLDDRSQRPATGPTWRARFVAENRRRPVVRGIQLGSLAAALVLYASYAVVVLG